MKNDTYTPLANLHYIGGHPDIIISNYLNLEVSGGNIFISNGTGTGVGVIFNRNITNVWISNESTFHTEVTFWRIMFFGILAFFFQRQLNPKSLILLFHGEMSALVIIQLLNLRPIKLGNRLMQREML